MDDLLARLAVYVAAVIRYRWYALSAAAVICFVGWSVVATLPDRYHASGRIYVDTKSILQPLLRGLAVDPDVGQEIAAMQQSLLSRPNLEDVAQRLGLGDGDVAPDAHEALIQHLRKAVTVGATGQSIFVVDVVWDDPVVATRIARALIEVLVESSVGLNREDIDQASQFLDQQIHEYETKLEAAESSAASFKQENLAYLPSSGGFQSGLDAAKQRELELSTDLRDARMELDILKGELAITPSTIEAATAAAGASGAVSLQAKLADLLTRYTDKHPDVIALRRKIEERERAGGSALDAAEPSSAPTISIAQPVVPNPSYAALKLRVVDKETEVAKLQERLQMARDALEELQSRAYQVPEVEARMAKLNRDYDVLKNQYEQLLARREQARVSKEREENGDKVQFRVVDPPRAPVLPSGPPRLLLLTAVLAFAAAVGVGVAIGLSLLRTVYTAASEIENDFDLPVVGSVSFVVSPGLRRRLRLEAVAMAGLAACLVGTYGLLMVVEARTGLGEVVSAAFRHEPASRSRGLAAADDHPALPQ